MSPPSPVESLRPVEYLDEARLEPAEDELVVHAKGGDRAGAGHRVAEAGKNNFEWNALLYFHFLGGERVYGSENQM